MGQEGWWYIGGTLRGGKMQGDDIIFANLDVHGVPDYVGQLSLQLRTNKVLKFTDPIFWDSRKHQNW